MGEGWWYFMGSSAPYGISGGGKGFSFFTGGGFSGVATNGTSVSCGEMGGGGVGGGGVGVGSDGGGNTGEGIMGGGVGRQTGLSVKPDNRKEL